MVGTQGTAAAARVAGVLCLMVCSFGVPASGVRLLSCGQRHPTFQACLGQSTEHNIQQLANGDQPNLVPSYEPMHLNKPGGTKYNGQQLNVSTCLVQGYSNVSITNFKMTIVRSRLPTDVTYSAYIPQLRLACKYSMAKGFIAGKPASKGNMVIEIDKFKTVLDYQLSSTVAHRTFFSVLNGVGVADPSYSNLRAFFDGLKPPQAVIDSKIGKIFQDLVVLLFNVGLTQVTGDAIQAFPPVSTWLPRGSNKQFSFDLQKPPS